MNYSLGNMLSRGGALNPDGLALDLQFAADKTLTARKGPTPTFTRASTATFVGSDGLIQSAAINAPRFDHDPVTIACKGLLIEESRANLILHSSNFKNTTSSNYWENLSATTITVDQTTAPDGTLSADLLTTSTALYDCFVRRVNVWAASTQYSYSIFVKRGLSNYRYIGFYIGASNAGNLQHPYFDFDNPTSIQVPTITNGTVNSTSVDAYPNGWYRIKITFTTAATLHASSAGVYISSSNGTLQIGNPAGNDCYIWGIQGELGAFPTSYIPTTTTTLTRSADVCSITGSDFTGFYNQSEGTMLANAFTPVSGDRTVLAADDNTANEMIRLRTEGTNPFFKVTDGGSEVVAIDAGTVTANTAFKLIGAYKVDDFASSVNGGSAVTDTAGTIPTVDRMRIGAGQGGNTMCGCISAIRYFKKRLPDAKLQSLTT
jgi:hypothetical protein